MRYSFSRIAPDTVRRGEVTLRTNIGLGHEVPAYLVPTTFYVNA